MVHVLESASHTAKYNELTTKLMLFYKCLWFPSPDLNKMTYMVPVPLNMFLPRRLQKSIHEIIEHSRIKPHLGHNI